MTLQFHLKNAGIMPIILIIITDGAVMIVWDFRKAPYVNRLYTFIELCLTGCDVYLCALLTAML